MAGYAAVCGQEHRRGLEERGHGVANGILKVGGARDRASTRMQECGCTGFWHRWERLDGLRSGGRLLELHGGGLRFRE
jgi:hypothetical protein